MHFKQRLEANQRVNGRRMEVTWRLTGGLERDLGLAPPPPGLVRTSLTAAIDQSDARITTPSTLYLESVLKRRPTAILDFYNSPNFVSAAWTINAPRHFNAILSELAHPPAAKLLFQATELHDQLACQSPATPRMIELVLALLRAREDAQRSGQPLRLPPRMLADPWQGFAAVESSFDLTRLFPGNEAFAQLDLARVQVELNLARERLGSLPADLEELRQRALDLNEQNHQLHVRMRQQQQRFEKLRANYLQLKERWQQRRQGPSPAPPAGTSRSRPVGPQAARPDSPRELPSPAENRVSIPPPAPETAKPPESRAIRPDVVPGATATGSG